MGSEVFMSLRSFFLNRWREPCDKLYVCLIENERELFPSLAIVPVLGDEEMQVLLVAIALLVLALHDGDSPIGILLDRSGVFCLPVAILL
jgi:hypothetical protein